MNQYVDLPVEGGGGGGSVDSVTGTFPIVSTGGSNPNISLTYPSISQTQSVYVSVGGSDTTGDGSVINPYATISKAMSTILDASDTKIYAIKLSPGTYSVDSLVISPNVLIVGSEREDTFLNFGNTGVSYGDFTLTNAPSTGFYNISIPGGNGEVITLPAGNGFAQISFYLSNIFFNAPLSVYGGNSADTFIINSYNSIYTQSLYISSAFTGDAGAVGFVSYNDVTQLLIIDAGPGTDSFYFVNLYDGTCQGLQFLNNIGSNETAATVTLSAPLAQSGNGLTIQGPNARIFASPQTIPPSADINFTSGAIDGTNLIRLQDANSLRYTPEVPASWPSIITVQNALDDLVNGQALPVEINISGTQTTYNGSTSGTGVWSMPFQGVTYKKFMINLQALSDAGGSITYPTAFSVQPYIYGDSAAMAVSSTNTTTFTLSATAGITGNVFVEGY
jgi:hypothetical protein